MSTLIPSISECASRQNHGVLPPEIRTQRGDCDPTSNTIKVMTMKVNKGLKFSVIALPGVGHMPGPSEDEKEAARVFYVTATRAMQRLVIDVGGDGGLGGSW